MSHQSVPLRPGAPLGPLLIVCVRGGVVQDVFGPADSSVVVIDWDEIPVAVGPHEPQPLEQLPEEIACLLDRAGVRYAQAQDV